MISFIASPAGFLVVLSLFAAGGLGASLFRKRDAAANVWSSVFAIAGSLAGMIFAGTVIAAAQHVTFTGTSAFPLLSFSVDIDALSAFFIFIISLVSFCCSMYGLGYVKHFYGTYDIGALGFFFHAFILGMLLVVSVSNGLFFLIAWEVMSVASYALVVYDRNDRENVKAGFLYLVMTHVGTAFILLAFLLLYKTTGSFEFGAIRSGAALIPLSIKNAVFILALIGFGTKAGIIPFHVWLPAAHPAAPSHVSGLMSGVMIKTGIFMMIRLYLDLLQPVPTWWGPVVLIVGAVSCLLGVLYALTEHDIKRLLAYHSIENIGIILLGVGSALTFSSLHLPGFAVLGLVAALFHTLNHAIFKSLLFLGAGSVINETHTRNMEEYGGLIRFMPATAAYFLIGAMAISALPPFNGFFSEWMTFQALFRGIASLDASLKWVFVLAAGSLAFTGGLALACFVKAFGVTFLARPRSAAVMHAKEAALPLRAGMALLALLSLAFGVFSGFVVFVIEGVVLNLRIFQDAPDAFAVFTNQRIDVSAQFASVTAPMLFLGLAAALAVVWCAVTYGVHRRQKVRVAATWDCGTDLTPRMEITATGFARSIVTVFRSVLRPSMQQRVTYFEAEGGLTPKSKTVDLHVTDVYQAYFYAPIKTVVTAVSERMKGIQSGSINAYVLYMLAALLIALLLAK